MGDKRKAWERTFFSPMTKCLCRAGKAVRRLALRSSLMRLTRPARSLHSRGWLALTGFGAVLVLAAGVARAEGLNDKSLSLRLPAAMSRFATYSDVAGVGGASAGSKWSSSINPASVAWLPITTDLHMAFSPQYTNLHFARDLSLNVTAEAFTWNVGDLGTFQPSLAQIRSNTGTTRQGLDFQIDMDMVQVQWAKKVSDDWAFGANFSYTKSKSEFDLAPVPGVDLAPVPVSDTVSETYGFRFGALNRMADNLLGGVVFDYAFTPSRTTMHDFMGLGIGDTRTTDMGHQFILRPGMSYEYLKDSTVYADYQYGVFRDGTGSFAVNRFYAGVDHSIFKWLFVRAGAALDTRGNVAWTTGLGLYPCDRFSIDIAYQNDMFPELKPEFGHSRTLTISVSFSF